jgi:hypothetical protein
MLRTSTLLSFIVVGLISLSATVAPELRLPQTFAVNSTVASFFFNENRALPTPHYDFLDVEMEADSTQRSRVLLLQYSVFDSAYAHKMQRYIQRELSGASIQHFWDGSSYDLTQALSGQDAVVITYPAVGSTSQLQSYGYALEHFVRNGGTVIIAGSHEYEVVHDYGLLNVDSIRYHADPLIHCTRPEHPMMTGVSADFAMSNYAYSVKINDPEFVVLGEVENYPMMGYKPLGKGRIIYLGFEFYTNETEPNHILANALQAASVKTLRTGGSAFKRTEQILIAGNNKAPKVNLHIYPNPYMDKGNLEFDLSKPAVVEIDLIDDMGRISQIMLPSRQLGVGYYRFDLPNVAPGVYTVRCKVGDRTETKRVVKAARQ